jgi:hypothetical protein
MTQPQHACIVRSYVDGVSNSDTARKLELARSDGCPFAAWCTPAQRMPVGNGERTAASIRGEPSDGLVRNLLRAPIAGGLRTAHRPTSPQVSSISSRITSSPNCRRLSELLNKVMRSLGASHCDSANVHAQSMIVPQVAKDLLCDSAQARGLSPAERPDASAARTRKVGTPAGFAARSVTCFKFRFVSSSLIVLGDSQARLKCYASQV